MADRYCGNCGNELSQEDKFCRNCGIPVHQAARVPTPEAEVPVPPPPQAGGAGTAAPQQPAQESGGTRRRHSILIGSLAIVGLLFVLVVVAAALGGGSIETSGGEGGGQQARESDQGEQNQAHDQAQGQDEAQGQGQSQNSPASGGSDFTLYTNNSTPYAGLERWSLEGADEPMVAYNGTGELLSYLTIVHPPDVLNLHPGPVGEKSVVRWTAPSSVTVKIEGKFEGIDTGGTTTDVAVVKNTTITLFSAHISSFGATAPFSTTTTLDAGDTIDFSVGYGNNATYSNDSTGLSVTITPTEPQGSARIGQTVVGDFSATDNPNGAWSYGSPASAGPSYSSPASAGSGYGSSASAGSAR